LSVNSGSLPKVAQFYAAKLVSVGAQSRPRAFFLKIREKERMTCGQLRMRIFLQTDAIQIDKNKKFLALEEL
jgi:hypothetical protein